MKKQIKSLLAIAVLTGFSLAFSFSANAQSTTTGNSYSSTKFLGWGTTSGDLLFRTNNTNRMVLKNTTGNFGIGATSPAAKLHIVGTNQNTLAIESPAYPEMTFRVNGTIKSYDGIVTTKGGYFSTSDVDDRIIRAETGDILFGFYWGERMRITNDGIVGIGTANPDPNYKLSVKGAIRCEKVVVEIGWADYVFNKEYKLMPINELEKFISANKHLPNIPSGCEIEEKGLDVGAVQAKQMEKIEELTLYIIELNKKVQEQDSVLQNWKREKKIKQSSD